MADIASPAMAAGSDRKVLALQVVVGIMLGLKLCFDFGLHPLGDEAYYWLWGQRLDFSYLDHPPLNAWLQALVAKVFGWNVLSLRLLTWVSLLGTLGIFRIWAKRLSGEDWRGTFWAISAVYLCSPVIFFMSTVAFNDHLMMFLCIVSAHFFLDFAVRLSDGEAPRYRSFYAAAVALGLAGLAKYDAIFMAVGLFGLVLLRPRLRALLRTPHPYLAMAICVAIQTPVFYWNFSNGFASYRYNLNSRLDTTGLFGLPTWSGSADFLATGIAVFSPFLIVAAVRAFRAPMRDPFSDALRQLALLVFAASTLAMLALCQVTYVLFYWNIVGYLLLYPAIVGFAGRRTLIGHSVFGVMMAALITFNGSVAPVASLVGRSDWESSVIYGWDDVAAAAKEALKEHPDALIGATRYTLASQLGFALGTADVVSFSTRVDQFKFWFDPRAHRGSNAIVLADASNPMDYVKTQFGSVTAIRTLPVYRLGRLINTFTLYDCEDYRPT